MHNIFLMSSSAHMNVCMYVCMYVCMCMCECMNVCIIMVLTVELLKFMLVKNSSNIVS